MLRQDGLQILSVQDYLEGEGADPSLACLNLCRDFSHQRNGYYVSLIGSSREQRVYPSTAEIEDLMYRSYYLRLLQEAGVPTASLKVGPGGRGWVPRSELEDGGGCPESSSLKRASVFVVFGRTSERNLAPLCRSIYENFPAPLLKVEAYRRRNGRDRRWKVSKLSLASPEQLSEREFDMLLRALSSPRQLDLPRPADERSGYFWLACLWDPHETLKPSEEDTLERFERIAARKRVHFNLITFDELARLPEYDALFIRTTTGVGNRTFEFAKMAESFGMPVIDDTASILRCGDKVYLHEVFKRRGVPTPDTLVVQEKNFEERVGSRTFPLILKSPGGSFSRAVKKAESMEEAAAVAAEMFRESSVLVVQEYMPTPFDWRVGVLHKRLLFAARYYMAGRHWQIVKEKDGGRFAEGRVEAVALEEVPAAVRKTALRATACIGDGLYGVDLKEGPDGPVVMEVNDNPDIHVGYEDEAEGDVIYERIIDEFVRRIRASMRESLR